MDLVCLDTALEVAVPAVQKHLPCLLFSCLDILLQVLHEENGHHQDTTAARKHDILAVGGQLLLSLHLKARPVGRFHLTIGLVERLCVDDPTHSVYEDADVVTSGTASLQVAVEVGLVLATESVHVVDYYLLQFAELILAHQQ